MKRKVRNSHMPIWTEQDYLNTKETRDSYVALVTKDLRPDSIAPPHGWPADSAFRSDDPYGGGKNCDWTYRDQERFEELWTSEGDEVANQLADRYAFGWPHLLARSLATSAPDTCRALMKLATSEDRPNFDLQDVPEAMFEAYSGSCIEVQGLLRLRCFRGMLPGGGGSRCA